MRVVAETDHDYWCCCLTGSLRRQVRWGDDVMAATPFHRATHRSPTQARANGCSGPVLLRGPIREVWLAVALDDPDATLGQVLWAKSGPLHGGLAGDQLHWMNHMQLLRWIASHSACMRSSSSGAGKCRANRCRQ